MGIDALVIRRGRKTVDGERTAVSIGSCTGLIGTLSGPQRWARSRIVVADRLLTLLYILLMLMPFKRTEIWGDIL
jgi:hypothetical protein